MTQHDGWYETGSEGGPEPNTGDGYADPGPRPDGYRGLGPKDYVRPDVRIAEEVNDLLTDDPWLDATDIDVAVQDGQVTLSGDVDGQEELRYAQTLVQDVRGVRHVQNNLKAQSSPPTG